MMASVSPVQARVYLQETKDWDLGGEGRQLSVPAVSEFLQLLAEAEVYHSDKRPIDRQRACRIVTPNKTVIGVIGVSGRHPDDLMLSFKPWFTHIDIRMPEGRFWLDRVEGEESE